MVGSRRLVGLADGSSWVQVARAEVPAADSADATLGSTVANNEQINRNPISSRAVARFAEPTSEDRIARRPLMLGMLHGPTRNGSGNVAGWSTSSTPGHRTLSGGAPDHRE